MVPLLCVITTFHIFCFIRLSKSSANMELDKSLLQFDVEKKPEQIIHCWFIKMECATSVHGMAFYLFEAHTQNFPCYF